MHWYEECTFDTDSSILAQEFLDVSIIIGGENLSAVFDPAFAFSPMYAEEGTICTNLVKNDDDGETYNCIKDVFVNVDLIDSISRSLLLGDVTIESDESVPTSEVLMPMSNYSSTSKTVISIKEVHFDNIAPVITCPDNIFIHLDPGACEAIVSFVVTATDNCSSGLPMPESSLDWFSPPAERRRRPGNNESGGAVGWDPCR